MYVCVCVYSYTLCLIASSSSPACLITPIYLCLRSCNYSFVWKIIQKDIWNDVQQVICLSGLFSILSFCYYRYSRHLTGTVDTHQLGNLRVKLRYI